MSTKKAIISFAAMLALLACEDEADPATTAAAEPTEVTVDQLASWIEAGEAVPVDANNEETRAEFGVIPDARLLTSSSQYDPAQELPGDHAARLVFYCGNEQCSASDGAAARAIEAGYENVHILRAGIAGWKNAGQPTTQPRS